MKGFIKLMWIVPIIFFLAPIMGNAEKSLYETKLEYVTDDALQMAKNHRYVEALRMLEEFESLFLTNAEGGHLFEMEELKVVNKVHEEALAALADSNLAHGQRVDELTKFRLAVDALLSDHQPMWKGLQGSMMDSFNEMKQAALNKDSEGYQASYLSFMEMYELIHPSLEVDLNQESVKRLDTELNGLGNDSASLGNHVLDHQLLAVEKELSDLFEGITDDETDPSLWWVIFSTGSIIILTLSYVGWQKYSAEKRWRKQRFMDRKN